GGRLPGAQRKPDPRVLGPRRLPVDGRPSRLVGGEGRGAGCQSGGTAGLGGGCTPRCSERGRDGGSRGADPDPGRLCRGGRLADRGGAGSGRSAGGPGRESERRPSSAVRHGQAEHRGGSWRGDRVPAPLRESVQERTSMTTQQGGA